MFENLLLFITTKSGTETVVRDDFLIDMIFQFFNLKVVYHQILSAYNARE